MHKWIIIAELLSWTVTCKGADPTMICSVVGDRADCSYSGKGNTKQVFNGFSQNVNSDHLTSLDVSGNRLRNLRFGRFVHLTSLYMRNMVFENRTLQNAAPKNWFAKLKALSVLDMSGISFETRDLDIAWPKKLTKLTLSGMGLTDVLGLEELTSLEDLDLSNNTLYGLPKLSKLAPMYVINLKSNPTTYISVEEVAPFCSLNAFSLEITKPSLGEPLNSRLKYKECVHLDQWFTKNQPDINTGLTCHYPPPFQVNVTFSEEAQKLRRECLNSLPATSVLELLLYAVFFSILFPLLYFGNEAYNRYQARQSATSATTPLKRKKRRVTTTSPPDVDVEADQAEDVTGSENDEVEG